MIEIVLLKSLEKEGLITKEELNKAVEILKKNDNKNDNKNDSKKAY